MMPIKSIKIAAAMVAILMLKVGAHGLMPGTTTNPIPSANVQVMLQVVDEAGQALERVCVQALEAKIEPGAGLPNMGFTDSQGWVTLGTIDPSKAPVTFSARLDGYAMGRITLTLTDPNQVRLSEIVLKKGLDVSGTAEYSDGVPATGIQLSAAPDWYHGVMMPESFSVDNQGRFVIQHILPGRYRISATPEMNPNDMGPIDSLLVYQTSLPLPDGETLTIRIPQASPGAQESIKGHIIWGLGLEQPELRPTVLTIITTHATTDDMKIETYPITDSNSFEIKALAPGTYTLQINGRDIMPILKNGSVPGPDLEVRLFKAAPRPVRLSRVVQPEGPYGQIEGIVYDANGNPAPFVNVTIKPGAYMEVGSRGETWGSALTDANGLYHIESAPAGRICVVKRMERGYTGPGVIQRACVPVANDTIRLDLGQGHTVTGTIQKNGCLRFLV